MFNFFLYYTGVFMNKLFYVLLAVTMALSLNAFAQDDFFDDLMQTEEMKQDAKEEQTVEKGQMDAAKLLASKPKTLKIEKRKIKIEETSKKLTPIVYEHAPMGLLWLAPVSEIEYIKVQLTPVELKDYPNTYKATNLPKPLPDMREIMISFGEANSLWRIVSYGDFIQDNTKASKGLAQYNKYYEMLEKKYGNAQEFYTPAVFNVEESVPNPDGTTSMAIKQVQMEVGDEGFLEKLASGEAVLYSTFNNEMVAVTLALFADGNNQSFIVIDYKNLVSQKKTNDDIYDAL